MGKYETIPIQKLIVWSENPRLGFADALRDASEVAIINAIFEVVDVQKMLALVKDVASRGSLNGNVVPTVVENGGSYYVYDGNRRISAIKVLLDPTILTSPDLRKRVETIKSGHPRFRLDSIVVYLTSEKEALELMDRTHSGELGGVGVIPWAAYNYDVAYNKRGMAVRYKKAFALSSALGWKKKSDFRIDYTDLERIFSSKHICDKFHICFPRVDKSKAQSAIVALETYKKDVGFSSYSRQFAQIVDGSNGPSPTVKDFLDRYDAYSSSRNRYRIEIDDFSCFSDERKTFDLSLIHVIDKTINSPINVSPSDLSVTFTPPGGKGKKAFTSSLPGTWKVEAFYKGASCAKQIDVCTPIPAKVRFKRGNKVQLYEGETLDIAAEIGTAVNGHGDDMLLTCSVFPGENMPVIENGKIFASTNHIGSYTVRVAFDNLGTEYSAVLAIDVVSALVRTNPPATSAPSLFVVPRGYALRFHPFIIGLMAEINKAWEKRWHNVCVAATRSAVELCCNEMDRVFINEYADQTQLRDLKKRFDRCVAHMKASQNVGIIQSACQMGGFHNTLNIIGSFDSQRLFSFLNVGAHTSAMWLDVNAFQELCQKVASPFICFADALIVHKSGQI